MGSMCCEELQSYDGAVKMDDEGCLSSKVVGDRDRETGYSVAVEINEANSEGNKWHS